MTTDALAVNTEQAFRALPMTCRQNGLVLKQVKRTETVAMYSVHFTEDDPPHGYTEAIPYRHCVIGLAGRTMAHVEYKRQESYGTAQCRNAIP